MPTSFLGENKSYFSLFFAPDGENQDPFLIQLSLLWHKKIKKQICQNSHPAFLVTFFNSVGSVWGSLLLIGIPGGLATQAEEYVPRRRLERADAGTVSRNQTGLN